jgi:hypothetical protein
MNGTALEKVPRHPVPQLAVVNVRTIGFPAESRMSMLTVASNTSAFPSMLTGLETSSPDPGLVTMMAGSGVGELEIVGEGEPVDEGPAPDRDPDEHATIASAATRRATSGKRSLMC